MSLKSVFGSLLTTFRRDLDRLMQSVINKCACVIEAQGRRRIAQVVRLGDANGDAAPKSAHVHVHEHVNVHVDVDVLVHGNGL